MLEFPPAAARTGAGGELDEASRAAWLEVPDVAWYASGAGAAVFWLGAGGGFVVVVAAGAEDRVDVGRDVEVRGRSGSGVGFATVAAGGAAAVTAVAAAT